MSVGDAEQEIAAPIQSRFTAAWFLKRLLLGVLILVVSLGGLAWLTHAAIDEGARGDENLLQAIGRLATNF